ncbi:MAG: hypothetical protein ABJC89_07850 [Acidobacteriota bacterium]
MTTIMRWSSLKGECSRAWDSTGRLGRLRWSNGLVFHKLRDEQDIVMAELGEAIKLQERLP